jgi:nicotinamidase-related amidase
MTGIIGTRMADDGRTARRIEHVNRISALARAAAMPLVWGTRTDTPDSLQIIKYGSDRHACDERCDIHPGDTQFTKRMPSAFFETPLHSLLVWHRVGTMVETGGKSRCVRATAVDALFRGYRTIVPIETTADKQAGCRWANRTDLQLKYADVVPVQDVVDWLAARPA